MQGSLRDKVLQNDPYMVVSPIWKNVFKENLIKKLNNKKE